jgi:hypothetical protein
VSSQSVEVMERIRNSTRTQGRRYGRYLVSLVLTAWDPPNLDSHNAGQVTSRSSAGGSVRLTRARKLFAPCVTGWLTTSHSPSSSVKRSPIWISIGRTETSLRWCSVLVCVGLPLG